MIVGTVQQEDDCSWQDACNAWMEQDEEAAVGVHQVRMDQGVSEQAAEGQCKEADAAERGEKPLQLEDLLVEGEEQEYFFELLMRGASPERPKESPPTRRKATPTKGKKNRSKGKKIRGKNLTEITNEETKGEGAVNPASGKERQVASNLAHNPEAKGRGLAEKDQHRKGRATGPPATSGGECSGQKKPDCS